MIEVTLTTLLALGAVLIARAILAGRKAERPADWFERRMRFDEDAER